MPRRMNFKGRSTYRRWLVYDTIHNPRFGARPVDVDARGVHTQGPYMHGHQHTSKHHGGRCGPPCRQGYLAHYHRSK